MILNGKELTPREEQLARLVSQGMGNKEMAQRLGTVIGTVKNQLATLCRKVGIPPFSERPHTKLARMVLQQDDPVKRLQAMAEESRKELHA